MIALLIFIAVHVFCGILGQHIAERAGLPPLLGIALGGLLNVFGLVILLIIWGIEVAEQYVEHATGGRTP